MHCAEFSLPVAPSRDMSFLSRCNARAYFLVPTQMDIEKNKLRMCGWMLMYIIMLPSDPCTRFPSSYQWKKPAIVGSSKKTCLSSSTLSELLKYLLYKSLPLTNLREERRLEINQKSLCWNGFEVMGGKALEDGYIYTGGRTLNHRSQLVSRSCVYRMRWNVLENLLENTLNYKLSVQVWYGMMQWYVNL
jgi:hypothetical protein